MWVGGRSEEENWLAREAQGWARIQPGRDGDWDGAGGRGSGRGSAKQRGRRHNLEALKGSECSLPGPNSGKIGGGDGRQARQGTGLGRQISLQTRRAGT